MKIAALFCHSDSPYKSLPDVNAWDESRDCINWDAQADAVITHPPCRDWSRLVRTGTFEPDGSSIHALWAVQQVRDSSGVLEHPAYSYLWWYLGLPRPGEGCDRFGGWTLAIEQYHWGHRAAKPTWLYIVGCPFEELPPMPRKVGRPSHVVNSSIRKGRPGRRPIIPQREALLTPPAFAQWLVELAGICARNRKAGKRPKVSRQMEFAYMETMPPRQ